MPRLAPTARRLAPAALLLLSGCGAGIDYDRLGALSPQGDDFNAAVAREYRDAALFEARQMYDWPDAARFGAKALGAAAGTTPEPERVADWRLPGERVGEIVAARARLTDTFGRDARAQAPEPAARAQARFDCWVEQQEENWQTADIARCRDGFYAALAEVEGTLGAPRALKATPGVVPATADKDASPAAARPEPKAYALFFEFDSAELSTTDEGALRAIVEAAAGPRPVHVIVNGHADRAGPDPYNRSLSLRRAEIVGQELIELGIDPGRITITAYGESRPRVTTPDGMREPRNRRVEILIGPAAPL
ncbi:MAG: OmpA family protein [Hyphomicrobiales bacterium]|nr:OmpA family protein [Hyphomicrobiales bacterium]MCP5371888.1 OmpA family protein [Hyphomicrobiales bacterium]